MNVRSIVCGGVLGGVMFVCGACASEPAAVPARERRSAASPGAGSAAGVTSRTPGTRDASPRAGAADGLAQRPGEASSGPARPAPPRESAPNLPEARANADDGGTPPLLVDGRAVERAELSAMLSEAAGGVVVEELVLERALEVAMQGEGLNLSPAMIDAERALLAESLASAAGVTPSEGERLIEQVRRNRGLGPVRFEKLLRRNAMLRALVRAGVDSRGAGAGGGASIASITEEDITRAYAIKHGPRVQARLILVRSMDLAVRTLERVRPRAAGAAGVAGSGGEPFGEVASEVSIDPSSQAGGRLSLVSIADPTYPEAVRRAFETLQPGEISDVLAVTWGGRSGGAAGGASDSNPEQGFAIVMVEKRVESTGAPSLSSARDALTREIRTVRERAAMDRLARDLAAAGARSTTVFDRSLDWSWSGSGRE